MVCTSPRSCADSFVEGAQKGLEETKKFVTDPGEYVGDKVQDAAEAVASDAVYNLARALLDGLTSILTSTLSWWVGIDSPQINDSSGTVVDIRGWVLPIAAAVAIGGAMWQGIRMMLMRKSEPLIDIARGLMLLAVAATLGTLAPVLAMRAGDSFSVWVINESTDGDFQTAILESFSSPEKTSGSIGIMLVLGVLAIIAASIQAMLLIFRDGAVILLSGVIVLAAAGSFTGATSGWLRKVTAWLVAIVFYKPVAALVYAATFSLIGNADDTRDMITALGMLIMSIFALPALMRLFDWSIGRMQDGGFGAAASVAGAGASVRMSAQLSQMTSANDHSRFMQQSLGPVGGQGSSGGSLRGAGLSAVGAQGASRGMAAQLPAGATSAGPAAGASGAATGAVTAGAVAAGAATVVGAAAAATLATVKATQKVAEVGTKAIEEPRRGS